MRHMRFYEEFRNKGRDDEASVGNVVAIDVDTAWRTIAPAEHYDGVGSVFDYPNSPVATTGVSSEYLRQKCKPISEERAREIHPALFFFLDQNEL